MNQLPLESSKETLSDCVIPTVPLGSHAEADAIPLKLGPKQMTLVLVSLLRMMNQKGPWPSAQDRYVQGIHHQPLTYFSVHRQTDNSFADKDQS